VNPRAQQVQPYFPGYLFVHVDLELTGRSLLEWIPGGDGLVSFGDEPAFVPDSLIYSVKQRIESLKMASEGNPIPLRKGDIVTIHDGVFNGYDGIFDVQLSGTDRVRVLLSLLGSRQLPVEMPVSYLRRLD